MSIFLYSLSANRVRCVAYKSRDELCIAKRLASLYQTMNFDTEYEPTLTSEGIIFRSLLCEHVLRKLRKHDMLVPAKLLLIASDPEMVVDNGGVAYSEVEGAFKRYISEFEDRYGEGVVQYLRAWPATKQDIEPAVVQVLEEAFAASARGWGYMATVAAYVTQVAINCARHRLHNAIIPVINYAAVTFDKHLTAFVRDNGGWSAFALALRCDDREPSQLQMVLTFLAGAFAVTILSVLFRVLFSL
jgi:hypothetical protein